MPFVQIIEYRTSRIDEIRQLSDRWRDETAGVRTPTRSVLGSDGARAGTYVLIVEFPSREDAERNSALPATAELADSIAKLCDEPPTFRDLDVIEDRSL